MVGQRITFDPIHGTEGEINTDNGLEIVVRGNQTALDSMKNYLTAYNNSVSYQLHLAEKRKVFDVEAADRKREDIALLKEKLVQEYWGERADGSLSIPIGFWYLCGQIQGNAHLNTTIPYKGLLPDWLRDYQKEDIEKVMRYNRASLCAATGLGKCHGQGTKILMFDGSVKSVEDIRNGDVVMGDDSTPRLVSGTTQGKAPLFRIIPHKGESFTCNADHILCLMHTQTNQIIEISVAEYLKKNNNFKHLHKLYRYPVTFPRKELPYDPYWVGLWIGDGTTACSDITTQDSDKEIIEYYQEFCDKNKFTLVRRQFLGRTATWSFVSRQKGHKFAPLRHFILNSLRKNGIKNIPLSYLTSDYHDRLRLLAGLIDSDGYLGDHIFEISVKNDDLAEQIAFLARSLGFGCVKKKRIKRIRSIGFEGIYNVLVICGDLHLIPTKLPRKKSPLNKPNKDPLKSGFKIEEIGIGDYYGFCVGKNHRYMLHDCTVTHNTRCILAIAHLSVQAGKRTCIIVPTIDLVKQTIDSCKELGFQSVSGAGGDYHFQPGCSVLVTTVQSAYKYIDLFHVILTDEHHHSAATTWFNLLASATNATHVYGLSATPYRTDGMDVAIHAFSGPLVTERTAAWGIANGWLTKPDIYAVQVSDLPYVSSKKVSAIAYAKQACAPKVQAFLLKKIESGLAAGRTIMVIFNTVKAGESFKKYCLKNGTLKFDVAHSGFRKPFLDFKKGETRLLVGNVKLFGEGVDVPKVDCIITLCNNSSEIITRQVIGRAMRIAKGKKDAIIMDIWFDNYEPYVRARRNRINAYLTIVDKIKEIKI